MLGYSRDMLMNIIKFLPPNELLKCAQNNDSVRNNDLYWKYLLKIRYNITALSPVSNHLLSPFFQYHRIIYKREKVVNVIIQDWLADTTKVLNLSGLGLHCWPTMLKGKEHLIRELNCTYNHFLSLPPLPFCVKLVCIGNNLMSLPLLQVCEQIWCMQNKISIIKNHPKCLDLDCSDNPIKLISNLPLCEVLYCYNIVRNNVRNKVTIRRIPRLESGSFRTKTVEATTYEHYINNVELRYLID